MPAIIERVAVVVALLLVGACGARPATPPPAEPYTSFEPAEVKVKSDPDWLAAGFGAIWLKRPEGFVDRIETTTGAIAAEIRVHDTDAQPCEGIGAGATAVWACDSGDLVGVDPRTNAIAEPVAAGKIAVQGRLVGAGGRIWVLAGAGDSLLGMDETTKAIGDPIPLPVACNDLGASAEVVYVVCESADRVVRVDTTSGAVTAEAEIEAPNWVSAGGSGVWVTAGNDLLRVDPVTLKTAVTVPGMGTGQLGSIWADATGVWVRKRDPFLARVDADGSIRLVISAPFETGGDVVGDGQHLWASAIDDRLVIRLDVPAKT
ncbi:MAG: hypothetical protein ACJ77D_04805 [Chloroflexota bacterium]|jgi:hypothetical protein